MDGKSKTSCFSWLNSNNGYPLYRKVINSSGRLGSLYDAATDTLIDRHSCKRFQRKDLRTPSLCRLFSCDQAPELISVLRNIHFNDPLRLSISLQMVTPSGISCLMEYNQPITEDTRFLYYCYRSRKERLNVKARKANKTVQAPAGPTTATHMITEIIWGFEILCIIQNQRKVSNDGLDQLLRYITHELHTNHVPIELSTNDQRFLNQLTNVTVYGSETCIEQSNISILDILKKIPEWQRDQRYHMPLQYAMQPLRWLYRDPQFARQRFILNENDTNLMNTEIVVKRINHEMKELSKFFQNLPTSFPSTTLNERLKDAQRQYRFLLDSQDDLQERLRNAVIEVRLQHAKPSVLHNLISDQRYQCLRKAETERFRFNVINLMNKFALMETFKNDRIDYILAYDLCSTPKKATTIDEIDTILKRSYSEPNSSTIFWYSSDRLKREQSGRWEEINQQLKQERQFSGVPVHLVYVDFTFFEQRLETSRIIRLPYGGLPTTHIDPVVNNNPESPPPPHGANPPKKPTGRSQSLSSDRRRKEPIRPTLSPSPPPPPPKRSKSQEPRRKETPVSPVEPPVPVPRPQTSKEQPTDINVLLLGETGVGKSTFINAFVNYLRFETLQQAESGQPVVLIPVSFLITVGDKFEEFIVRFGNADSNEDHEHEGQSVTQQCKSYVFNLTDRLRLRLIDTPGIGDTRGYNQDVKNIDHVLNYIHTLPHINAICLLLKPNASRLNIFFRSCIKQLLTYLTPSGYNNIIFCFTNARSTFFAPGDTGPLLRKMLNDENLKDIPFKKENTFCFDSESFRYLAARKCGINFDDFQRQEYFNSWQVSVKESMRLLDYIQRCEQYCLEEWLSPRKAAMDISIMARPLMETLRLIVYNSKLTEAKLTQNQIALNCDPVSVEICTNCAQTNLAEVGPFWCTQYQIPALKNSKSRHRNCPENGKQFPIECIVTHQFVQLPAGLKDERWQSSFRNFLFKCDRLLHYTRQQNLPNQDDPFEPILERFLEEEQQISQIRNINSAMNRRVYEVLNSIRRLRDDNSRQLVEIHEDLSVHELYQIIDELVAIPTVRKQVDIIKRSRQMKMKDHEYIVPDNIIKKRIFG